MFICSLSVEAKCTIVPDNMIDILPCLIDVNKLTKHFCLTLTSMSTFAASKNLGYISVILLLAVVVLHRR